MTGLLAAFLAASPAAEEPALRDVLSRAGDYVSLFQRQFSGIVSEEHYVQTVWSLNEAERSAPRARVDLRSEFLLVKPAGADRYVDLRDTFEVNGRQVREQRDRLWRSFFEGQRSPIASVRQIINESARYNIGDIQRTVNVPTLPLLFLHPRQQWRFKFERTSDSGPDVELQDEQGAGPPATFRVSTEVWVVAYKEDERPTLVHTPKGRDRPVHGRFWIEPATGRVLMSELAVGDKDLHAVIVVSYQSEPLLGFLVPIEMRERYEAHRKGTLIEGAASYSAFKSLGN